MDEKIKEIEERAEKATPGPWRASGDINHVVFANDGANDKLASIIALCDRVVPLDGSVKNALKIIKANADFIAHARTDIPELLAEVKRLRTELDRCTSGNGTYISIESHNRLYGEIERKARDARNELCLKCGKYHEAHNGACDGCKWKEATK